LLYLLAAALDGRRDLQQVAAVLSADSGRIVQPEQVTFLIDNRFRPAGIMATDSTAAEDGTPPRMMMRSDPLLALRFRVGVVPEQAVCASRRSSSRCSGRR
jgi:putative peptide zinc metalloprotease protein